MAVLAGVVVRALRGETLRIHITKLDRALVVLAVLSSVWPLFWLLARGQLPTSSDVFFSLVLWRLAALYALFRWVVRTPEQVRRCFWILVGGASVLALIALAQALGHLNLGGVWTPTLKGDTTGRGGATLNSAIATGDYLAYSLAVALPWYLPDRGPRRLLGCLIGVIAIGSLGTGQFSAWIGALIVFLVVVSNEGAMRRVLVVVPAAHRARGVGGLARDLDAALGIRRAAGACRRAGSGASTTSRTSTYRGSRGSIGCSASDLIPSCPRPRPGATPSSSRVACSGSSGSAASRCSSVSCGLRVPRCATRGRVYHSRGDDIGVAALAARAAFTAMLILTVIDMHLTMRGGGDLFFVLLGLSANLQVPIRPREPVPPEVTRLERSLR